MHPCSIRINKCRNYGHILNDKKHRQKRRQKNVDTEIVNKNLPVPTSYRQDFIFEKER